MFYIMLMLGSSVLMKQLKTCTLYVFCNYKHSYAELCSIALYQVYPRWDYCKLKTSPNTVSKKKKNILLRSKLWGRQTQVIINYSTVHFSCQQQ